MYTYNNHSLLTYPKTSTEWLANDSLELYTKNLQRMPESWYYRHHTVTYTWNSQGYRCAEFDTIDWSSSIVFMGCSYTMGLGLDDSDIITRYFDSAVNLGQHGVSINHIQYNTLQMIDLGWRPSRVIVIVPDLVRTAFWGPKDWVDLTPHDFDLRGHALNPTVCDYYRSWLTMEPMAEQTNYMTARSVQALWQSQGVRCDLYTNWQPINPVFTLGPSLPEPIDWARDYNTHDFAHPGRHTQQLWAEFIHTHTP